MAIVGNGVNNLLELMMKHPKAKDKMVEMELKHLRHLKTILLDGEKFILSMTGNHNQRATFMNLHQ